MNNFSLRTPAQGKNNRKVLFVTIALGVVVAVMLAAALVQNRGLHVDASPNGVGMKLDAALQPVPSLTTHNDGSPIVTAPGAQVEVSVMGPTRSVPAQVSAKDGISTHGAASPIVTGQGAVVKSTVDTRP